MVLLLPLLGLQGTQGLLLSVLLLQRRITGRILKLLSEDEEDFCSMRVDEPSQS